MNIKIQSEELIRRLREAIHIMENMRKFQKLWQENHGVELKTKKVSWEGKADAFLLELGTPQIVIKS